MDHSRIGAWVFDTYIHKLEYIDTLNKQRPSHMALLQSVLVKLCAPPDKAIKDICTNFLRLTSKAKLPSW